MFNYQISSSAIVTNCGRDGALDFTFFSVCYKRAQTAFIVSSCFVIMSSHSVMMVATDRIAAEHRSYIRIRQVAPVFTTV